MSHLNDTQIIGNTYVTAGQTQASTTNLHKLDSLNFTLVQLSEQQKDYILISFCR